MSKSAAVISLFPRSARCIGRAAYKSVLLAAATIGMCAALAQTPTSPAAAVAPSQATSAPSVQARPARPANLASAPRPASVQNAEPLWADLTSGQRQALAPLTAEWSRIGEAQKRKWIAISRSFPKLAAPEQEKMHARMKEWAALSPAQRVQARFNFAETSKLTPEKKASTWEAYQALSAEDKARLAAASGIKPAGATSPPRPVLPQKLATVPVTRESIKPRSGASAPMAAAALPSAGTASASGQALVPSNSAPALPSGGPAPANAVSAP